MKQDLVDAIRDLVADLARGRFGEVEADGRAGRLSASELSSAIRDYGRTLVLLPAEAVPLIDVYPNNADSRSPFWTCRFGLPKRDEATSPLSLLATKDGDKYRLEISDLHVL